ncbi:MAG: restriction endonuclease, partial [Bacteroidaceae bacterium]|nr:restriction endonuclease [Bacteroidaceae bacterium]
ADQGDTPYNLRNCAYMEDFQKPKIIYPNMTKFMPFTLDLNGYMTNQKCFIVTGMHIGFLTAFFNSSLFKFCFRETFPMLQAGTREMSKIFFDKIPVKRITEAENMKFSELVTDIQANYTKEKATHLDSLLFDMYGLTQEERASIGFIEIQ